MALQNSTPSPPTDEDVNSPRRQRTTVRWIGIAWCLIITGVIVWQFASDQTTNEASSLYNVSSEARPVSIQSDGYVGSKTCQQCHQREYDTWHASYHRTMTQVASVESVVGDFDDVHLEFHGRSFRLGRDEENFWVEFENPGKRQRGRFAETLFFAPDRIECRFTGCLRGMARNSLRCRLFG